MLLTNADFLTELAVDMPQDERLICCWFSGDPSKDASWVPRAWAPWERVFVPNNRNIYVAISSFRANARGEFRRQTNLFGHGLALMVDDIGTKVNPDVIKVLQPTALIETSLNNYQAWYFLNPPATNRDHFAAVIRAFIHQQLLGNDPGMAGVNRVGRLPIGINGKPKANDWSVKTHEWRPQIRYTTQQLLSAFKLNLTIETKSTDIARKAAAQRAPDRIAAFRAMVTWLEQNNMFKAHDFNIGGWRELHCPWRDNHTDRADTGAALGYPNVENGWYGAFQCHHGHCQSLTLRNLTDWVADTQEEILNAINAQE